VEDLKTTFAVSIQQRNVTDIDLDIQTDSYTAPWHRPRYATLRSVVRQKVNV